jgi:hypothetical protein
MVGEDLILNNYPFRVLSTEQQLSNLLEEPPDQKLELDCEFLRRMRNPDVAASLTLPQ